MSRSGRERMSRKWQNREEIFRLAGVGGDAAKAVSESPFTRNEFRRQSRRTERA
jgi:hypothetical protein